MRTSVIQDPKVRAYFNTLLLLPDDVVLDLATREFHMHNPYSCLCGWAIRVGMSRLTGKTPEEAILLFGWSHDMSRQFGGTYSEWHAIFVGVTNWQRRQQIELAFAERLNVALG
jgi:hypothetical protein